MHFPLDNSVCRVATTCLLAQIVKSIFPRVSCWQYWTWLLSLSLTFSPHGYDCLPLSGTFHTKENRGRKKDSSSLWINFRQSFNNQTGKQMILLSLEKGRMTSLNVTRTVKDVVWRHRFLIRGMMEFFIAEYSIMLENEGMMLRTIS